MLKRMWFRVDIIFFDVNFQSDPLTVNDVSDNEDDSVLPKPPSRKDALQAIRTLETFIEKSLNVAVREKDLRRMWKTHKKNSQEKIAI